MWDAPSTVDDQVFLSFFSAKGFRVLGLLDFRPPFFPRFLKLGASLPWKEVLSTSGDTIVNLAQCSICEPKYVMSYIGVHKAFVFRLSCKPPLLKLCLKTPPCESARTTPKGWPPHNFFFFPSLAFPRARIGENRQLLTDEPVEFEK